VHTPKDEKTELRMRAACNRAAADLGVNPVGPARSGVRSIGSLAETDDGKAWLRVCSAREGRGRGRLWTGNVDASRLLPPSIPRPVLLRWYDFAGDGYEYRAELFAYLPLGMCTDGGHFLTDELDVPDQWWTTLRAALTELAAVEVETDRHAVGQAYLDREMAARLGRPEIPTRVQRWTLAHGDLHFGNITREGPVLMDWETWGLAPAGHDAASLVTHAVQTPDTCARAREELADFLDGPEGRFAELAVITETLHIIENGYHAEAEQPLRERARELVEICEREDWR
jgi:hypothetical protein